MMSPINGGCLPALFRGLTWSGLNGGNCGPGPLQTVVVAW